MFTWLNKQGVQSTDGFVVQSVSRFVIEYREGNKCISIKVESDYAPGIKPHEKVKSHIFLKWDDGSPIEKEKQEKILKNFTEAMEFQGIGVIVD